MAHQSGGWDNASSSPASPFDLERSQSQLEFPLDEAVLNWFQTLKQVWGSWKRCETLTYMFHEYFATAPNPYLAALDILVNCVDFRQAKPNSLAYTVMEEFSRWIGARSLEYQQCLSSEVKLIAFDRMIRQRNFSLIKMICVVYKMAEEKDIFLIPLRHLLLDKQYKEVCQIAALLNLHNNFTIEDFLIPLVFQDKLTVAEEFLAHSTSHQQALVSFLDSLLGKRNVRNEADIIVSQLDIPDVHVSKLYYKPLSKLVARLTKQYNLPPTVCPNLNQKRNEGALQFLVYKRFQENSLGVESWREMACEAVGNNLRLQSELVSIVGNYDPKEAYYFVNEFNVPRGRWPHSVESYYKYSMNARTGEDPSQNSHSKGFQENSEESWDTEATLAYHTLSLPEDQIIIVNTDKIFQHFLHDILTCNIPMIGIDSEWKPYFGTKKNELALLQIATKYKVYILDVMVLGNTCQDLWKQFGNELFGSRRILKIGFGLNADMVMIKHSLPYLGAVLQAASDCLDILFLWKKLVQDYSFVFPYSESTLSTGESLTHLVELCLGRQLDKSDQFSNWERRPLRPSQITYAALDAYVLLEIYDIIEQCCIQQEIPFDEVVLEVTSTKKSPKRNPRSYSKSERAQIPIEVGPPPFPEPISPSQLKVVCDTTVEGLGKHLRICGVDTVFIRQSEHHDICVRVANQEGRMVITRGRNVWSKLSKHLPPGYCYAVTSDTVDSQLREVLQYFNVVLSKDDVFSRCKLCNGNEFARVSQATMKRLLASYEKMTARLYVEEDLDGGGFSSESDACSDEGLAAPIVCSEVQQVSEIVEGVDINKCCTEKGVPIQVKAVPPQRLEQLSEFNVCQKCGKCYWDGTHLHRYMNSTLRNLV